MHLTQTRKQMRPKVFLSYAFEDSALAERIARELQSQGIDTWWAGWSLKAGDSLRQKIDEGLENCTHFIVLLTSISVEKPWVKVEIDAAFVRKLELKARFIPLRYGLSPSKLPPLLRGMLSPTIDDFESDIRQL